MNKSFRQPSKLVGVNSYNVKKILYTICFMMYLSLSLIHFITHKDILLVIILSIGLLTLAFESIRIKKAYIPIYILLGMLIIFTLISSIYISRTGSSLIIFLNILSNAGIAMIILKRYIYNWGVYIPFYGISAFFIKQIITGVESTYSLQFSSFNGISISILVPCVALYIILSINNDKIILLPALIALIISIWGIGRSGIISSAILVSGLFFLKLRTEPKFIIFAIFSCLIFILFFTYTGMVFTDNINIENAIYYFTERLIFSHERYEIWSNYFNKLELSSIIFGSDVHQDEYMASWFYNYHNSFIALHSYTGFMGIITIILMIFSLYKFYKTNKMFFILLLVMTIRMTTDACNFITLFDFIPFCFIFYFLSNISLSNTSSFSHKIIRNTV